MKPICKTNANGDKHWWLNNKRHREDGPAVEYAGGFKYWYLNGNLHREDGPAVEHTSGFKEWYLNGNLHREDGPAVEWVNGDKEWFLNDKHLSKEEWFDALSFDSQKLLLFNSEVIAG